MDVFFLRRDELPGASRPLDFACALAPSADWWSNLEALYSRARGGAGGLDSLVAKSMELYCRMLEANCRFEFGSDCCNRL